MKGDEGQGEHYKYHSMIVHRWRSVLEIGRQ